MVERIIQPAVLHERVIQLYRDGMDRMVGVFDQVLFPKMIVGISLF